MKLRPNALIIWLCGLSLLVAVGAVIQVTRNESKPSRSDVRKIVQQIDATAICAIQGINQNGDLVLLCHAPKSRVEKKPVPPKGVVASHGNRSPSSRPGGARAPSLPKAPASGGGTPGGSGPGGATQTTIGQVCDQVNGLGLPVSVNCP